MKDALPHVKDALPIAIESLVLRAGGFADGRILIRDFSLRIAPGERWVVLGPNGAGKSTLLAALAGLTVPAAGRITLGDRALNEWPPGVLARERAWCPQFWLDPFPLSVWESVACAVLATHPELDGDDSRRWAQASLEQLDVAHLSQKDVRALSGGERQRVALATACAQAAPILLLDEPTAHLDWGHQVALQLWLKRWTSGASATETETSAAKGTAIVAVHDLNLAWTLATHALLLDGNGGACFGPREDVLTASTLQAAYGVRVNVREEDGTRWFRVDLEKENG